MVHHISGGKYVTDYLGSQTWYDALDGNLDKVEIVDPTPDGGGLLHKHKLMSGRAMKPDHMPTKLRRGGPGLDVLPLLDIDGYASCLLVNATFRDILENLEPSVHQFFPMAVHVGEEKVADRWWLNICNRLDTYDRNRTYPLNERGFWKPTRENSGAQVFSIKAIGDRHAWHDKFGHGTYISDAFAELLQAARLTGITYQHFDQA